MVSNATRHSLSKLNDMMVLVMVVKHNFQYTHEKKKKSENQKKKLERTLLNDFICILCTFFVYNQYISVELCDSGVYSTNYVQYKLHRANSTPAHAYINQTLNRGAIEWTKWMNHIPNNLASQWWWLAYAWNTIQIMCGAINHWYISLFQCAIRHIATVGWMSLSLWIGVDNKRIPQIHFYLK